jgi:TadE-like protein
MRRGESGQAIVEAAFVLPAMVFLILCAIQLAQIQQARLLAEYAAFNAARAGIVHSGDPEPMHDAAVLSILPSTHRTDDFVELAKALVLFKGRDVFLSKFGASQIRVFVHGPRRADFAKYGAHLNGREIDFDDVRPGATEATLLEIQVRYLYEMHVPFANKLIQTIWMATHAGTGNVRALDGWTGWDLTSPKAVVPTGPDAVALTRDLAMAARFDDGTPEGVNLGSLVLLGAGGRYYFPVQAFYTMRMQSNPFLKWAHP